MAKPRKYPPDPKKPLVTHLIELRDRLLRMLAGITIVFLCLFPFANDLYTTLAQPLIDQLPEGSTMIATEVASPFLTPFKFTLVGAFFLAIPWVLYQVWRFIAPGLFANERKMVLPLIVSSTLLFYAGMSFAYFVVFPLMFEFFIGVTPQGVAVMTDISKYLDFVLKLFFAFGLAFEIPIATILMVWAGLTTPEKLVAKRPFIIVGVFVVGMMLTPPDVISQTLLAVPMWALFEIGVILSRIMISKRADEEESSPDEPPPPSAASQEDFYDRKR